VTAAVLNAHRGWCELLAGSSLLALGAAVLAGWWLQLETVVQLLPGAVAMVPNTALGFMLAGAALWSTAPKIRRLCAAALIVLAACSFAQDLFSLDLHLDQLLASIWIMDPNPAPGRMAPQTALCFIASGVALMLLDGKCNTRGGTIAHVLALMIGATGIVSLIGYSLKLELLYSWYRYTRMAIHTAGGFTLLGIALWLQWYRRSASAGVFDEQEDRRVNLFGSALIVLVAAVGGSSGFILLAAQTEAIARASLAESLDSKIDLVALQVQERRNDIAAIETQALQNCFAGARAAVNCSPAANGSAPKWLHTLIRNDVVGIRLQSADGRNDLRAGRLLDDAALEVPFTADTTLLWDDRGATLRFERIVDSGPIPAARLTVETRLPVLSQLIADSAMTSPTGDLRICSALSNSQMRCLPTRLVPTAVPSTERTRNGMPLAMSMALDGDSGTTVFRNYRDHQVIGAYASLAGSGLGFVLQQDTEDLYAPLRRQLQVLMLVLAALIVFSIMLLRSQLAPLVRQAMAARAEAAANATRVSAIMNSVPDGIITIDEHGAIVSVNPAFSRMFGYAERELLGQPLRMLMPTEMQAAHEEGFRRYVQGGPHRIIGQGPVEVPAHRRDGTIFTAQLALTDMRLGEARYVVGNMRDITVSKFAEAQLRKVNERLKLATQAARIGVWEWDLASEVLIWDHRMHELHATPITVNPTYEMWRSSVHPADVERVERMISATLAGEADFDCEFRLLLADGSERTMKSASVVAWDAEGNPLRVTGVNWDVTETKRLERMKSEFVSVVSHELRTPLTSIRGSLGLIAGNAMGELPERARQLVDIAYRNTDRLTALINDILDIEKIESGGLAFEQERLELRTLIEHAVENNQSYAAARHVRLHLEPSTMEANVIGDAGRILQVMANLLSNAMKFSPSGAQVDIRLAPAGESVRVSVQDHGAGLEENFRSRVFQKFSQADSSDTRAKGGTGLGLAISKAIIERLGGRIGYDSIPGAGATFYFELPLADAGSRHDSTWIEALRTAGN
jgi:PAS domain S-box-containing protein